MPKPRKKERIACRFYSWLLGKRGDVYIADGRSNSPSLGRPSLGTRDRDEALRGLHELDLTMAVQHRRADPSQLDALRQALIRDVLAPLAAKFPIPDGETGFADGRLHSFRHDFCSTCANSVVPERVVMAWLGHRDSRRVRRYEHLHDEEAHRQMGRVQLVSTFGGRPAG